MPHHSTSSLHRKPPNDPFKVHNNCFLRVVLYDAKSRDFNTLLRWTSRFLLVFIRNKKILFNLNETYHIIYCTQPAFPVPECPQVGYKKCRSFIQGLQRKQRNRPCAKFKFRKKSFERLSSLKLYKKSYCTTVETSCPI